MAHILSLYLGVIKPVWKSGSMWKILNILKCFGGKFPKVSLLRN